MEKNNTAKTWRNNGNGHHFQMVNKEGDQFKRGSIIAEIDSDKTTVELPALEDGKLLKVLCSEGEEIE